MATKTLAQLVAMADSICYDLSEHEEFCAGQDFDWKNDTFEWTWDALFNLVMFNLEWYHPDRWDGDEEFASQRTQEFRNFESQLIDSYNHEFNATAEPLVLD